MSINCKANFTIMQTLLLILYFCTLALTMELNSKIQDQIDIIVKLNVSDSVIMWGASRPAYIGSVWQSKQTCWMPSPTNIFVGTDNKTYIPIRPSNVKKAFSNFIPDPRGGFYDVMPNDMTPTRDCLSTQENNDNAFVWGNCKALNTTCLTTYITAKRWARMWDGCTDTTQPNVLNGVSDLEEHEQLVNGHPYTNCCPDKAWPVMTNNQWVCMCGETQSDAETGNSVPSQYKDTSAIVCCPSGQMWDDSNDECVACPSGTTSTSGVGGTCVCTDTEKNLVGIKCTSCPTEIEHSSFDVSSKTCQCVTGYVKSGSSCVCNVGYHKQSTTSTTCVECSTGKFQNTIGSSTCTDCPIGWKSSVDGSTTCVECSTGKFQNTIGSSTCTDCQVGKYQDQRRQGSCKICEGSGFATKLLYPTRSPSNYQNEKGKSGCKSCLTDGRWGTFYDINSHLALVQAEIYGNPVESLSVSSNDHTRCVTCAINNDFASQNTNIYDFCHCRTGHYRSLAVMDSQVPDLDVCKACPIGKNLAIASKIVNNQAGLDGSPTSCDDCPAGKYQDVTAQTSCKDCPIHFFQDVTTQTSCKACPSGWYQDQDGQQTCKLCALGEKLSQSRECESCIDGQYQTEYGKYSCKTCGSGQFTFNNLLPCQNCPTGLHSSGATNDRYSCKSCVAGTFAFNAAADNCNACPVGKYLTDSSAYDCKFCETGERYVAYNTDCEKCPGGQYQNSPDTPYVECAGKCQPGSYSNSGDANCKNCPNGWYQDEEEQTSCKYCHGDTNRIQCNACAGVLTVVEQQVQCIVCTNGKYHTGTSEYNHNGHNVSDGYCEFCPTGRHVGAPHEVSGMEYACDTCAVGQYRSTDTISCQVCPTGQYQDDQGHSTCKPCLDQTYQDEEGQTACKTECPVRQMSHYLKVVSEPYVSDMHDVLQPHYKYRQIYSAAMSRLDNMTQRLVINANRTGCDSGMPVLCPDGRGLSNGVCIQCDAPTLWWSDFDHDGFADAFLNVTCLDEWRRDGWWHKGGDGYGLIRALCIYDPWSVTKQWFEENYDAERCKALQMCYGPNRVTTFEHVPPRRFCGVPGAGWLPDNSTKDCNPYINGIHTFNECGTCGNNNSPLRCMGCDNKPYARNDECGICDGPGVNLCGGCGDQIEMETKCRVEKLKISVAPSIVHAATVPCIHIPELVSNPDFNHWVAVGPGNYGKIESEVKYNTGCLGAGSLENIRTMRAQASWESTRAGGWEKKYYTKTLWEASETNPPIAGVEWWPVLQTNDAGSYSQCAGHTFANLKSNSYIKDVYLSDRPHGCYYEEVNETISYTFGLQHNVDWPRQFVTYNQLYYNRGHYEGIVPYKIFKTWDRNQPWYRDLSASECKRTAVDRNLGLAVAWRWEFFQHHEYAEGYCRIYNVAMVNYLPQLMVAHTGGDACHTACTGPVLLTPSLPLYSPDTDPTGWMLTPHTDHPGTKPLYDYGENACAVVKWIQGTGKCYHWYEETTPSDENRIATGRIWNIKTNLSSANYLPGTGVRSMKFGKYYKDGYLWEENNTRVNEDLSYTRKWEENFYKKITEPIISYGSGPESFCYITTEGLRCPGGLIPLREWSGNMISGTVQTPQTSVVTGIESVDSDGSFLMSTRDYYRPSGTVYTKYVGGQIDSVENGCITRSLRLQCPHLLLEVEGTLMSSTKSSVCVKRVVNSSNTLFCYFSSTMEWTSAYDMPLEYEDIISVDMDDDNACGIFTDSDQVGFYACWGNKGFQGNDADGFSWVNATYELYEGPATITDINHANRIFGNHISRFARQGLWHDDWVATGTKERCDVGFSMPGSLCPEQLPDLEPLPIPDIGIEQEYVLYLNSSRLKVGCMQKDACNYNSLARYNSPPGHRDACWYPYDNARYECGDNVLNPYFDQDASAWMVNPGKCKGRDDDENGWCDDTDEIWGCMNPRGCNFGGGYNWYDIKKTIGSPCWSNIHCLSNKCRFCTKFGEYRCVDYDDEDICVPKTKSNTEIVTQHNKNFCRLPYSDEFRCKQNDREFSSMKGIAIEDDEEKGYLEMTSANREKMIRCRDIPQYKGQCTELEATQNCVDLTFDPSDACCFCGGGRVFDTSRGRAVVDVDNNKRPDKWAEDGCPDIKACNYNPISINNMSSCSYNDADNDGVCDDILDTLTPVCGEYGASNYKGSIDPETEHYKSSVCNFTLSRDYDTCSEYRPLFGCTDVSACDYNWKATQNDLSCTYFKPAETCDNFPLFTNCTVNIRNANLGNCTDVLMPGQRCTPLCDPAYTASASHLTCGQSGNLSPFSCIPKTCTDNKYRSVTGECVEATSCSPVQFEYTPPYATDDRVCIDNMCLCIHGIATTNCTTNLLHKCASCDEGFRLSNETCSKIECVCPNGIAADLCTIDTTCVSCNDGYYLNGTICVSVPSCDAGYYFSNHICRPWGGKCVNGYLESSQELRVQENQCASCDAGYYFSNHICRPWAGKCTNGYLENRQARRVQENQCGSCGAGYYLSNSLCVPLAGECANGYLENRQELRVRENQCGSCGAGYYLKDAVCLPWSTCSDEEIEISSPTSTLNRLCIKTELLLKTVHNNVICASDEYLRKVGHSHVCSKRTKCGDAHFNFVRNSTTDTVCVPRQPCNYSSYVSEYKITANHICTPLTICNTSTQYETVAPTTWTDRQCLKVYCEIGEEHVRGICQKCTEGKFRALNSDPVCIEQPKCIGSFILKNGNVSNARECEYCPTGKYQDQYNQHSCKNCTIGKYSPFDGSESCTNCQMGKFRSEEGGTVCQNCASGKYQDHTGANTCKQCDEDSDSSVGAQSCFVMNHCQKTKKVYNTNCNCNSTSTNCLEYKYDYITHCCQQNFWRDSFT